MGEAGRPGGQRQSEMTVAAVGVGGLALWCGHPARRCPALCVHRAAHRRSECIFHRHHICPSVPTQNKRDGLAGWGGEEAPHLPYLVSRSQSRTSVNDAHPWKLYMPPGIHVHRQCSDVIYVCHSIRGTDRDNAERTAIDIKAHTPLIRLVVGVLYLA